MDPRTASDAPSLDRSTEVWVGRLPGLGSVSVDGDGTVTVEVEPTTDEGPDAQESVQLREDALRFGWGEALSFVQRGFRLVGGAAVCPPEATDICLILNGDAHDTAIMIIELARHGWTVMGDRFTPTVWKSDDLVAWPREAPLIVSGRRLAKAGLEGTKVRDHTDSYEVDLPRTHQPRKVAAICRLRTRKPGDMMLQQLTGHERFEVASSLMLGAALSPRDTSGDAPVAGGEFAAHLRLVALPFVRLGIDSSTPDEDAERLISWWDSGQVTPR